MSGVLYGMAVATVVFAAVLSFAVTRRYGWGAAVVLPLAALAAMIGMSWQQGGLTVPEGLGLIGDTLTFAAPILLGALVGMVLARWMRA